MTSIRPTQQERQEKASVDAAPDDEGPVGAVPKSAHEEDDEDVADGLPFAHARTTQRNVEVIAEPGGQRDVPTPPELCDIAGEVGRLEVGHELDAKEFGGADGDVAVAGEVTVDLEGKIDGAEHEGGPGVLGVVCEDVVGVDGAGVRHHHLLEHPPQDEPQAGDALLVGELALVLDLGQKPRGTLDGPGNELREETHERRKIDEAAGGFQGATVNVNGVRKRLEGVEADAHGQDDLQRRSVHGDAHRRPRIDPTFDEEVGVFKVGEEAEVD